MNSVKPQRRVLRRSRPRGRGHRSATPRPDQLRPFERWRRRRSGTRAVTLGPVQRAPKGCPRSVRRSSLLERLRRVRFLRQKQSHQDPAGQDEQEPTTKQPSAASSPVPVPRLGSLGPPLRGSVPPAARSRVRTMAHREERRLGLLAQGFAEWSGRRRQSPGALPPASQRRRQRTAAGEQARRPGRRGLQGC